MTKLASALPEGDANGLAALAPDLCQDPHKTHLAIVVLDCKTIVENTDTGAQTPTARIRRIEPITGQDKPLAAQMLRRALEERTGQAVLPIDLEDDLNSLFDSMDLDETAEEDEQ